MGTKKINDKHPRFIQKLTLGQRAADSIAKLGGSWTFIITFFVFILLWVAINTILIIKGNFDPYPFILLNFVFLFQLFYLLHNHILHLIDLFQLAYFVPLK